MPDLASICRPETTALVTSEIQNGVVGPQSRLPHLAEAAAAGMLENIARLADTCRTTGAAVVHCTAARRADGMGANHNARLFAAMAKFDPMLPGSLDSTVVDDVGVEATDLVLQRLHGLSPMGGTDLDPILRNLGVMTIVAVGVSVNVAITNMVFDAVNLGYQVVIPRDAVAGVPAEYADAVIDNTLFVVATVTTTDDVIAAITAG